MRIRLRGKVDKTRSEDDITTEIAEPLSRYTLFYLKYRFQDSMMARH